MPAVAAAAPLLRRREAVLLRVVLEAGLLLLLVVLAGLFLLLEVLVVACLRPFLVAVQMGSHFLEDLEGSLLPQAWREVLETVAYHSGHRVPLCS